jgi:hypothetical protein
VSTSGVSSGGAWHAHAPEHRTVTGSRTTWRLDESLGRTSTQTAPCGIGFLQQAEEHQGDPMNLYPFIEAEKAQQRNVKRACELLEVSRAAYYAQRLGTPSARQVADAALTEQIRQAHQVSKGRHGAPRIHAALRRAGHRHSRKRVARLMRWAGLRGRTARRWTKTTVPDPAAPDRADLIRRDFTVNAAAVNTRWCGDITYICTWETPHVRSG